MVRTKDLILYLVVLIFILMGATYTGLASRFHSSLYSYISPDFAEQEALEYDAINTETKLDRKATIEDLRSKITLGRDTRADDVAVAVPAAPVESDEDNGEDVFVGERSAQYCNVAALPNIGGFWPAATTLTESEGLRVISTLIIKVPISTSTAPVEEKVEILTLPVRQIGSGYTTCLPDTLVGITKNGQPLYNNSASLYQSLGANVLVGYSRDGFPIRGVKEDEKSLDECGGSFENGQYSYHIRTGESFVLGCYVGIPTPIKIPTF